MQGGRTWRRRDTEEVIPSASRLIGSLREVGYDILHAVADLVDNSIAAGASVVNIDLDFDGRDSWIRIADDGCGMSCSQITEAMRFGSDRKYEIDDLGKFGLGLKMASLSQCRCVTVASRVDRTSRKIEIRQWDVDHVDATNRWEVIKPSADERPDQVVDPLVDHTGTVVLWQGLDRVLDYKNPWGEKAKSNLWRIAGNLDQHLGMVFHRFLNGEARRRKCLQITINGTTIEPWDPFARREVHD